MGTVEGINRAVVMVTAQHYENAPGSGYAVAKYLYGILASLIKHADDDPLLFAYQLNDHLPAIASHVISLQKWSAAVIDATPEQIQDTGAIPCR